MGTPIMGTATVTADRLAAWGAHRNPAPRVSDWATIAGLYLEEGAAEGVAGDLAWAQCCHETSFLAFGGDVQPEQNNFAGLAATGGVPGASFPDVRTGIRAQIQHLKAYASTAALHNPTVDPRFNLVTRGLCPTWESLDGHWAVPGVGYGETIVGLRDQAAHYQEATVTIPAPLQLAADGRIIGPNVTQASPFPSPNGNWGFHEPAQGMASHTEVGYEHNVIAEFENPGAQASAFCSVAMDDGHITQYGPIGKGWMAWTQAAGNPKFRGVEHEDKGNPANPYSDPQIASSAQLLELFSLVDGFPIQATDDPINGYGNIFHSDGGAPWGGHDCPGNVRRAQRPQVIAVAAQIRAVRTGSPIPNLPGGTDVPAPTDHVRRIAGPVPGSSLTLTADGGVEFRGLTNVPPYTVLASDGATYSFPWVPSVGAPPVIAYPGLPAQYRQGQRWFSDIWLNA